MNDLRFFTLFGATSTDPDGFAATEDALIEYSWALLDKEYAPRLFFDFLRHKTILLLGCDFPDWLGRFFIHALTRQQDAKIAVVYVSSCCMCGLHDFLERKNARLFTPYSPILFIEELHRRWQQQQPVGTKGAVNHGSGPIPSVSKRGAVFISYAKEDRPAASAIRAQLEAANIDTWMDESELESGMEFEYVIKDNIERASFFVAVISRAHDIQKSGRLGRYVLGEWHWGEKVNEKRLKDDCFLRPVVVDDTPAGASFIERPFRDLHWTSLENGELPPEFIDSLRQGIRRYRSSAKRKRPMKASTHPMPSPLPDNNPWKGLYFYTEEDRAIFFGRSQETQEFLQVIQRDILSVLFACSGLGKTSLLRAGIIPRLAEEGFLPVIIRLDYAANAYHPTQQIVAAVLAAAVAVGMEVETADTSKQASSSDAGWDTLWEFFHQCRFLGTAQ